MIGEKVKVTDLSSYRQECQPPLPAIGTVVRVDPYPYIVVDIKGKEFELYEGMYEPGETL